MTKELGDKIQLVGGRFVCHQHRALAGRRRPRRGEFDFDQGEPDWDRERNFGRDCAGPAQWLHIGDLASVGGRAKTRSLPTWLWRRARGRSRRAPLRGTDRVAKYNQLLRIEEALARWRHFLESRRSITRRSLLSISVHHLLRAAPQGRLSSRFGTEVSMKSKKIEEKKSNFAEAILVGSAHDCGRHGPTAFAGRRQARCRRAGHA